MDTVISADGTAIVFERMGAGAPIILVGGALNDRNGPSAGTPLAAQLAAQFTAIAYDRRGRGDSGDTAPYAVEREIEDLNALITAVGGSAFVHGMSSGAALALRAAAHGLPINRLSLYEPPFISEEERLRGETRTFGAKLTALLSADDRGGAVELMMAMAGLPAPAIDQMKRSPTWSKLEALAPTLAYDSAIMADGKEGRGVPRELAASITIPTLVIDGKVSPSSLRQAAREVARIIPNSEHRSLDGQAHNVDPLVLAPVLMEFFSR